MSLTSIELNYLIWRYLQESGFELAAYALEKNSRCLSYEDNKHLPVMSKIEPGCLVNLVQKGILYTLSEEEAGGEEKFSLFKAILEDEPVNNDRFLLKSEYNDNKKISNANNVDINTDHANDTNNNATVGEVNASSDFVTEKLTPVIKFEESIVSDWISSADVFAYGKSDSSAVISAIVDDKMTESVTLVHPSIIGVPNDINIVSWSPQGNIIVTAGLNGELRAWSPDGKLRSIANEKDTPIHNLIWNGSGTFLLSLEVTGIVSLWNGVSLNLVQQFNLENDKYLPAACWIDEYKFAISASTNTIQIFAINKSNFGTPEVQLIGVLNGHDNHITCLTYDPTSKLLASCSDYDYLVRLWTNTSSNEIHEFNNDSKLTRHTTPILTLKWLEQGNLLSVSMDGAVNIWSARDMTSRASTNIFKNITCYKVADEATLRLKDPLIFSAKVSPNLKYLAVGDDYARVSIWDVEKLQCLGIYDLDSPSPQVGVCDLSWDSLSQRLCANYKGADSVVFNWK